MRKLIFITASVLAMLAFSSGRITAADEEQTFFGSGRKVSGSILTVYAAGQTHTFQITGSTNILDSNGKATDLGHSAHWDALKVTYTGKKEPYLAEKVECLTHNAWFAARDKAQEDAGKKAAEHYAEQQAERNRKRIADIVKRNAEAEAKAKAKADAADEEAQQQVADEARAKAGAAAEEKEQDVLEKADAAEQAKVTNDAKEQADDEQPRNVTAEKELEAPQAQEKAPAADEKEQEVPEKAQAAPEEQQQGQPAEDEPTPGPH